MSPNTQKHCKNNSPLPKTFLESSSGRPVSAFPERTRPSGSTTLDPSPTMTKSKKPVLLAVLTIVTDVQMFFYDRVTPTYRSVILYEAPNNEGTSHKTVSDKQFHKTLSGKFQFQKISS